MPIPFALIRLVSADPQGATLQQGITSAEGRFRFVSVIAGDYHVQLLRIGYRPVLSPVVRVRAAETVHHELRAPTQAVLLPTVTVHSRPTCLDAAQLANDPRLASLWSEARKGVEIRRAFELQYRFTRTLRQNVQIDWRFRRNAKRVEETTLVNEPDSVLARDERLREQNRAKGYTEGGRLVVPNEKELLDEAFLREHCLETSVGEADGALGLRFRPAQPRPDLVDIRGTIWVEADTYQIQRLDLEHVRGDRPFAWVRVDYADVVVGESKLRLPSAGSGSVRPRGLNRTLVTGAAATFTYTYRNFEQVRAR